VISRIEFFTPTSLEEALDILTGHPDQAMVLAGGTDLLLDIRN
jgi:CO/xanthine dehydrogenase FAD-binding subunit